MKKRQHSGQKTVMRPTQRAFLYGTISIAFIAPMAVFAAVTIPTGCSTPGDCEELTPIFRSLNVRKLLSSSGGLAIEDATTMQGSGSTSDTFVLHALNANNDTLWFVRNDGRVGVGTSDPAAYLHVKAGTTAAETAPIKLTAGQNTTVPENGAIEFDGSAPYFTTAGVRRALTMGNDTRVTDLTVANTTTETVIHTSPVAANELKAGKMYKITLLGKFSTANSNEDFTIRFKMGDATLISAVFVPKAVTNEHFMTQFYLTVRTVGATGTYAAHVEGLLGSQIIGVTPVTGTVDTTEVANLTTTMQWTNADAGNTFTVMQSVLEVIN